ncbi:hemagglutinin repeat-containing protein [uncultured Veillonella sp.]|uniref:hemagglutinin repeat-containing protein n=1 Tax=uncultured Veillonella sp. TaxID=159268 RepID=UPI0025E89DD7|nr:hemagglutinin repeat-containing protein [uncultured Veillonella sp.]
MTSKEEVKNSTPGVVRFGGDVSFTGNGTNENSQMVVGGILSTTGAIDQVAKENQEVTNTFGTTEASYTYKRRWPHKSRRRGYKGQVFMTPQVNKENPMSLGVSKKEDKNGKAKGEVGANHRKEVQDFLNPFAQDSSNDASKPTAGTNILSLPTESLYRIHPESTANYVVETDPQFTNKKAFLSSDYIYKEMKTKPENIEKRLGDGLYEQTLVRQQIVSGIGYRFLDGYTDDESQFKALMDAGITYAKQHGILPGVALTAEQAASLTSDMIWLVKDIVMVAGKPVEVIYPKVYLKQSNGLQLHNDGTLISANTLVMNAKESIRNEGVIQGKTVVLASNQDIINSGHINADKVGLQSDTTIHQQGQIVGRDAVELQAKEDITFNNSTEHLTNQDVLHKTAGIAVTGNTGVIIVSAGNDVNLGGATIEALGKEGAITITAGHDINSTTDTLTAKKDMTQDGDNYLRTYRQTELGTTIEAGGNVSIGAQNDIKARNLTVSSDSGAVKVIGEHDVSIENGYSESKDAFALKYKEKGLLNKKETKIKTNDESKHALMSTVSGHTVVVGANNDVTLTSSNVVSTAGTSVLAGHNVITDAAAEHTLSTASKDVKKSGIMGAGMGIMIGKKQSKDNYYIDETTHKATTLGSTDGEVTVQAGDTVHLTTTDIIADNGIKLSGQDIALDGKEDHYLSKESHEYKSSGLTVSLGGSVANAINTAYGLQQKAKGREDKRLAALEYMEAGKELKTAAANIHDYTSYTAGSVLKKGTELKELGQAQITSAQELKNASLMNRYSNTTTANVADYKTKVGEANISKGNAELADLENNQAGYKAKKRAKADNLVNIHVSIGSSSSRSESSYEANTFDGGSIESNGDITIEANSADSIKGNIKAVGETISGKTVKLVASNDVSLQAATNTSEKLESAKSKGWSVGANISVAGSGILGFDASANAAKQKSNTKVTTHTGTTVVGFDAVTITSGKDTHIRGSKVIGKSVTADVGGNLSIESLQDTKTYVGESSNKGFSVSTNAGSLNNVSMSSSKGKMKSDYASVTDQAGIYAGDGGFVINTAETTSLRGAVIDSTADSNKNKLSTKLLDVKDVENTAEYTSRNVGMSYNHVGNYKNLSKAGKDAVWNTLGALPNLLPDSSKSSSSTTKSAISNGTIEVRDANFNMQTLSRDTKDSLNKLDEIFDKKKIEERQELSKLFAKEAFGQLHNWNPTSKEGKAAKAIAHGVVAEVSARMAGNKPGSGFYAGATNEALVGEIQKIAKEKPDVAQTLSALLGAAVNGSLGHSPVTGAVEAQYGTKWNIAGAAPMVARVFTGTSVIGLTNSMNQLNSINNFIRNASWILTLPNTNVVSVDNYSYDAKQGKNERLVGVWHDNATSDASVVIQDTPVLEQRGPIVVEGQQYEWDFAKQSYYPVEIYHLDGSVYKNNNSRDILSRHYLDGLGGASNRYTGSVFGKDGTKNWVIEPSASLSSKAVQVKNTITGEIGEMSYSYGDMYLVDHPESSIVLNPNTKQFIVTQTLQPVSKPFVLAYKNRISSATAVDVSNIGNEGWVDNFTYNPEFSKPKILSSPIPESVEPKILKSPTNENAGVQILSSPLGQELNISKLGGFDLVQPKLSDYIYTAYSKEHPVWGMRVPQDAETILSDRSLFDRTGKRYKEHAQIYRHRVTKHYYYRDTFHEGVDAHLEVFDKNGNHLGEADPITGVMREKSKDPKKKLRKDLRQ